MKTESGAGEKVTAEEGAASASSTMTMGPDGLVEERKHPKLVAEELIKKVDAPVDDTTDLSAMTARRAGGGGGGAASSSLSPNGAADKSKKPTKKKKPLTLNLLGSK
jgi:hypothetical protein